MQKYANYILFGLLSLAFLLFGGMKVLYLDDVAKNLGALHYGPVAGRIIGIVEVAGALLFWVRPYRTAASIVIGLVLAGAAGSHIAAGQELAAAAPAVGLGVLLLVANLVDGAWGRISHR